MFGYGESDGIFTTSIKHLLEQGPITVAAIQLMDHKRYDLNAGETIENVDDLHQFTKRILSLRKEKPTNQNPTSSRSHLIFKIRFDGKKGDMAFVDLAGWENAKEKENVNETKFINSTLTELNTALANLANDRVVTFNEPLLKIFKPYLVKNAKTLMLYHVNCSE